MEIKTIRGQKDIIKVADLFVNVFSEPPYNETWPKEDALKRLSQIYSRGKPYCFYVEEDGKVIGLMFCSTLTWHDGEHILVEDAAVDLLYRGKGIGQKLVEKIEGIAKQKGICVIDMESIDESHALKFWQRLGYQKDGTVHLKKRLNGSYKQVLNLKKFTKDSEFTDEDALKLGKEVSEKAMKRRGSAK